MKILKIIMFLFLVMNFSELKSAETNDILKNKILKKYSLFGLPRSVSV